MGNIWGGAKLEDQLPDGHFFGFENFGNTCYCNAVLQALHFCDPFREHVIEYYRRNYVGTTVKQPETLLSCLGEMFYFISQQKKKVDVLAPKKFVIKVRKENATFRGTGQHDAQEFLNYLLNAIAEHLQAQEKQKKEREKDREKDEDTGNESGNGHDSDNGNGLGHEHAAMHKKQEETKTFVHDVFEGILTNETKCLCCETVTNRDESFLDLSIDIADHCSITHCLKNFSAVETLAKQNKFYCDTCNSLQEAEKSLKIKKLPNTLIIHLKRFKYDNNMQCTKLLYRVVFPFELRLWNTSADAEDPERYYDLFAIVVHIGSGPHVGHYIAYVKRDGVWLGFDDETVSVRDEEDIQEVFGSIREEDRKFSRHTGYLLFYKTRTTTEENDDMPREGERSSTEQSSTEYPVDRLNENERWI